MINYDIIDVHNHIYPDKIAEKAAESIGAFYGGEAMYHSGSSSELISSINKAGISKAVICSAATTPGQVESINNFISEECKNHGEFLGLGTMHPGYSDIFKETKRIKELGLIGIKLHPDFQQFFVDDFEVFDIYRALIDNDLFLLCHMGDNKRPYTQPRRMVSVLEQFPKLKLIAAHFGGYRVWEEAYEAYKPGTCYFDISSSLQFINKELAFKFFDKYGIENFFWGTDFPMWDHKTELERFLALGLSDEQNKMILHDNFYNAFLK